MNVVMKFITSTALFRGRLEPRDIHISFPFLFSEPRCTVVCFRQQRMSAATVELIKWYHARDMLLGRNVVEQDVREGLRLARECKHEDAAWFVSFFPLTLKREAMVEIAMCEKDARLAGAILLVMPG
jgi:hypothetical protein